MSDYLEPDAPGGGGGMLEGLLANVPTVLWQRRWLVVVPLVLAAIASVAAAFLIPASYRSQAVLLVESSQIATDGTGQVAPEVIDERIAKVRQQVLSRPDLIAIIQELQLYPGDRGSKSLSEIVEAMREDIVIEPVSARIQQRSGSNSQTIAFSMAFDYTDPNVAQSVAQRLVERILEVDSTRTAEQASDAVRFLTEQTNSIRGRMDVLEQQLTSIKARYGVVLANPGSSMYGNVGSLDAQIAMLERENAALRRQRTIAQEGAPRDPLVQNAEANLAALRATYAESHPDVVIAKQRLAEAKLLAERNIGNLPFDQVASQIESNTEQIGILRAARMREAAQASAAIGAQAQAPLIQQQAAQLQQQLDGLNEQYQASARRLALAQTTQRVDSEQRGERLTVVDPPVANDEPAWPDRWLIIGGGTAAGLALGLLLAFLVELVISPLRGPAAAAAATGGGDLLGAIPVIKIAGDEAPRRRWFNLSFPKFWKRQRGEA
jgi:polysaccharide biosynthesis transport protein